MPGRRLSERVMEREERASRPAFPYDTETMTRRVPRPARGRKGGVRYVTRKVARSYDAALKNRLDWYHTGGPIYSDKLERDIGYHPAGWFIGGYKWVDDRPEVLETIEDVPTLEEELADEPEGGWESDSEDDEGEV